MTLSPVDRRFLDQRRARTHVGLYVLPAALVALVGTWVGLFAWWPLAVNPMHAAVFYEGVPMTAEAAANLTCFPKGTLTQYAITTSILVNLLLLVLGVAIVFGILWARGERRYLKLLADGSDSPQTSRTGAAPAVKKSAETPP
jgi:hypothetical protein